MNRNSLTHGCYVQKWDGRTRDARALAQVQAELAGALGDVTPQEVLLVQRSAMLAFKCAQAEAFFLWVTAEARKAGKPFGALTEPQSQRLTGDYVKWNAQLRENLRVLGLKRRETPVQDLQAYLHEHYNETTKVPDGTEQSGAADEPYEVEVGKD